MAAPAIDLDMRNALYKAAMRPEGRLSGTVIGKFYQIRWYDGVDFGGVICTVDRDQGDALLRELRGMLDKYRDMAVQFGGDHR